MKDYVFERTNTYTKPILIMGKGGMGKTTFAHQILEGRMLTNIDTTYIRDYDRLNKALCNLRRHNITQMLGATKNRGILLDDIHVFLKEDPKGFSKIADIINKPPLHSWIVATCHDSYKKRKKILKLPCERIVLDPDISEMYRICKHLLSERRIHSSTDIIDNIVYDSSIRQMVQKIEGNPSTIGDTPETLSEKNMESLDLLDNLGTIIDQDVRHRYVSCIYQYYVFCDILETFVYTHHCWDMLEYSSGLCAEIKDISFLSDNILPGRNKYISKSLICIGRESVLPDISSEMFETIYMDIKEGKTLSSFSSKQVKILLDTVKLFMK